MPPTSANSSSAPHRDEFRRDLCAPRLIARPGGVDSGVAEGDGGPAVEDHRLFDLHRGEGGEDVVVTVSEDAADHQPPIRSRQATEIVGEFDQRRCENVRNDDVELALEQ